MSAPLAAELTRLGIAGALALVWAVAVLARRLTAPWRTRRILRTAAAPARVAAPAGLIPCPVCRETGIAPDNPADDCEYCIRGYRPASEEDAAC